jgi:hypothetical protein
MAEPPMLDGATNSIMPPVLMGVTTKLVGASGTCAWATPKQKREKNKMKLRCQLLFRINNIKIVFLSDCFSYTK